MTAPQSPGSPGTATHWTDLKFSRVAATGLAAVTTALLGSMLGAEGTLIGAAAASVVTTVATSVYQTSLERSRERVRSLAHRSRSHPPVVGTAATVDTLPSGQGLGDGTEQPPDRSRRSAMWRWGGVVAGALGGFVLAMIMITGIEWASGETVGGNGKGTTIGQVVDNQSGPQQPSYPRPDRPPAPTGTPTEPSEPPATSTTAPSGGTSVEPSPTETPTTRPSPSETAPPPLIPPLPHIGG
jgi:hypothetical protein